MNSSLAVNKYDMKQLTKDLSCDKIRIFFDVDATALWIKHHGYRRVALQFSDHFLSLSADIATLIEKKCSHDVKTYILADTTYRSCCVDFVAAEQCGADCIVHYGDSCMSEIVNRLPTRFVFGNMCVEWEALRSAVHECKDKFERSCCLLFDALYANSSDTLFDLLTRFCGIDSLFNCKLLVRPDISEHNKPSTSNVRCCLGRESPKGKENMTLLFIGETNSPLLPLWLMTNLNCVSVFSFSPTTLQHSFGRTPATRFLRKRLFLIEKLRDARTVGLVINALDVSGYKQALERTRELCKVAGKKSYTLAIGKINVPKLSNFFNEIEAFVVLSCPYGVILDVSDFYRPVLSLFEAEAALNPNCSWSADDGWTAEFKNFLHDEIGNEDEVKSDVSLVTGKIRSMGVDDTLDSGTNSSNALSTYTAGDYFLERTWKGLDDSHSGESVAVEKGRSGVASQYNSEPSS